MISQRQIYDERFAQSGYDQRSTVRTLTAERELLARAVTRAVAAVPTGPVTVLDFGHGTGRVLDDLVSAWPNTFGAEGRALHVTAYDVSSTGLAKSAGFLAAELGFQGLDTLRWDADSPTGYVAGDVTAADGSVRVRFVHGNETEPAGAVHPLLLDATDGRRPYLVTTSWYSALGHIPGAAGRKSFFDLLADLTDERGEFVVAVSSLGDLVDAQRESREALENNATGGLPIDCDQDVTYETELGQLNFVHVFGPDLQTLLAGAFRTGHGWLEAVRYPDDEFQSLDAEAENYRLVQKFNDAKGPERWSATDFQELHTVAAIHSGTRSEA